MYISSDNLFWNWFFCCWNITSDGYNLFSLLKLIIWKYLMILCWFVLFFYFFLNSEVVWLLEQFWFSSEIWILVQLCFFCFSSVYFASVLLFVADLCFQLCFFCFSCVSFASVVFFFASVVFFFASVLFILLQFAVYCYL